MRVYNGRTLHQPLCLPYFISAQYGLGGPGIEPLLGMRFWHPYRPALGPTQPPVQWISGFFPGRKAAGVWH